MPPTPLTMSLRNRTPLSRSPLTASARSGTSIANRQHRERRGYLQVDPAASRRYAEAKRANVRRWSDDGWGYTEAKTGVVLDIREQAANWARATDWASPGSLTAC